MACILLLGHGRLTCESTKLQRRQEYGAVSSSEFDEVVVRRPGVWSLHSQEKDFDIV